MAFDPILAETRFGTGLAPWLTPATRVDDMLARVAAPDVVAALIPIPKFSETLPTDEDVRDGRRAVRRAETEAEREAALARRREIRTEARWVYYDGLSGTVMRGALSEDGFRERLVSFWTDHFTVVSRYQPTRHLVSPYVEEAIRPHITGRFGDLLRAVATHPMMLRYLDQHRSVGPESDMGRSNDLGLNENLARELMELHTLGVNGPYTQADVRELAELLTGLWIKPGRGLEFRPDRAEPGFETVLGTRYGGGAEAELSDIHRALEDLAAHPATARHLARKLVVHFVTIEPEPDMVARMAEAYLANDTSLLAAYEAMLTHPAAWRPEPAKVKRPLHFVQSTFRALDVPLELVQAFDNRDMQRYLVQPLRNMGQEWQKPLGPNGWPEEPEAWITPQGMAARIDWAMKAPDRILEDLPDPRDFVRAALGPAPDEAVTFAAGAAETRRDGIGIVLSSAAFQRS